MPIRPTTFLTVALAALLPAAAHALCTSDGVPQPQALLERFVNADCADCWTDKATPAAARGTLALDWIIPGTRGDDAPLAAAAHEDALERLYQLERQPPARIDSAFGRRVGEAPPLRLAQGEAFNDYVGASIELREPGRERWQAWLLLVEELPAGVEGSPVARNVVRNVFRPDWQRPAARPPGRLAEMRSMQIRPGAKAERLRLVAVLHDQRGRIRGIVRTECR